jgi:hypothetical protein
MCEEPSMLDVPTITKGEIMHVRVESVKEGMPYGTSPSQEFCVISYFSYGAINYCICVSFSYFSHVKTIPIPNHESMKFLAFAL